MIILKNSCFYNRLETFSQLAQTNLTENIKSNNVSLKDIEIIFKKLGALFLEPKHTINVVLYFKREILQILFNVVDFKQQICMEHQHVCVALAKLVNIHPDVECFILNYFQRHPAPFECKKEKLPPNKKIKLSLSNVTDLDIVIASYTFLRRWPDFFKSNWTWSLFIEKYFYDESNLIRWYCCQCLQILTGMNEHTLQSVIKSNINECARLKFAIENLFEKSVNDCVSYLEDEIISLANDNVICVSGLYLPIYLNRSLIPSNQMSIVDVESTNRNLRKLAIGIVSTRSMIIQGPIGSGKTFLIDYLAAKMGRILGESFVKVQLSDQTDSKMLLGTYCCTDVPGEFVWQAGVLTQAVIDGNWLLLEDIDLANMDIASLLTALLENGYLTVPGYRDAVPISTGFKLFMTQRLTSTVTGYHKKHTSSIMLLEKISLQVNIEPLTSTELEKIIRLSYSKLTTIADRIVQAFLLFSGQSNNRSNRLVSTRDLFKWCRRAIINFDVTSQNSALRILQDAIDIFCCAYSNTKERLELARHTSSCLGIIIEKADFYCNFYKPALDITSDSINSDRVQLKRKAGLSEGNLNFCFTISSSCLLERIMCCVNMNEPVLLVGETGTGKTLAVQYLAHLLRIKLIVINMNQQSDSADLLGGYKPVDLKFIIGPVRKDFEKVFNEYFNVNENKEFLKNIDACFESQKWNLLLKLMVRSCQAALQRLHSKCSHESSKSKKLNRPKLKRTASDYTKAKQDEYFLNSWLNVHQKLEKMQALLKHNMALAFSFIEGSLIEAIKNGYWVLLDEINLANAETLECMSGLLEDKQSSINLIERGDKKPVQRHPYFKLFACMNPSTDVGKRDLPAGLRNRFTEFFVDELTNKDDLIMLVDGYLHSLSTPVRKLENIVEFYLCVRKEAQTTLTDGLGHKPHYSLRTLCRALTIAARNPCRHFIRSLYEAFSLSFLTQLDTKSYKIVETLIAKYILGSTKDMKSVLHQPIPKFDEDCIQFEGYWIARGTMEPDPSSNYILTDSVRHNLKDLVRVVSIGKSPVLLQGDTSVGKTSLITYLAKSSGNKCVRINNHEHTDLQEYVGSYVVDSDGKLIFREGLLVEAMRKGHWLILDELNLAPTEVLEALNRVLDDNRELFIPETRQVVKAHSNFVLFATQNPPGLYGGRKMLSRAFRNRFVELHFNEIPPAELEFILHKRCEVPLSYSRKMVAVMSDLQVRRRGSAAFAGKQGFITLRDLFRWGERYRFAANKSTLYDWDQHVADEGYLLLAGRVRKTEEQNEIAQTIQKHMKREIIPYNIFTCEVSFSLCSRLSPYKCRQNIDKFGYFNNSVEARPKFDNVTDKTSLVTKHILEKLQESSNRNKNIVWTYNMRQLAVLVAKGLQFKEPVLLVGETGGGKTTACQVLANLNSQKLYTVNCHMHTESGDFIGGLRPVRDRTGDDLNKLFEWVDGPLVKAMTYGGVFLVDEISLADDSVLERLNSLLEPERSLLLVEKGSDINRINNSETLVAHESFHFVATMNPGGDYGKKELSPALRNRFTEVWCESCTDTVDLIDIIEQNIEKGLVLYEQDGRSGLGKCIMDFVDWFKETEIGKQFTITIRDVLTWTNFINVCGRNIGIADAFLHGACLTFLDSLGSGNTSMEKSTVLKTFQQQCIDFLMKQLQTSGVTFSHFTLDNLNIEIDEQRFGITPFYITLNEKQKLRNKSTYFFHPPTCVYNTLRLLRGLQLKKPILLEGSPGVGKTSLVLALAKAVGVKVLRINLSDQTDICDLFGADFPVENGVGGSFAWRDGPFLQALKKGHWILLDELNLASQSVLEGLNACLDHRREIFIPELGKTFFVEAETRLFACQNPVKQGGSRRGLPQSFLNRFTQVFINPLNEVDLKYILIEQFPSLSSDTIKKLIEFNSYVVTELDNRTFGCRGSPWEFNLRDLVRWCEVVVKNKSLPEAFVRLIYSDRMRTANDKHRICEIFQSVFGTRITGNAPTVYVTETKVYIGDLCMKREITTVNTTVLKQSKTSLVLRNQIPILHSVGHCVNLNWMVILVGASGSGKSSVIQTLANLLGKTLRTLPVTSAMDTTDILGSFEQIDYARHLEELSKKVENYVLATIQNRFRNAEYEKGFDALKMWEKCSERLRSVRKSQTMAQETELFKSKLRELINLLEHLKSAETSFENIFELQQNIQLLLSRVLAEDNLHAGGKFEWIDSLLIKCLEEGSWLVIDNVNLCSPAVLDRLNGLLEPNGVLKIGERGIKENGKIFKVKPHQDFRLFLTMDPKNGEISRAMRNRGVEIYLLGENEEGYIKNDLDLKSLINHNGLSNASHINALLKIHNFISDLSKGEKPNTTELLQAAFLTSQQLSRGTNVTSAMTNAVLDVYYNRLISFEFTSCDLSTVIKDNLNQEFDDPSGYYENCVTLNTSHLSANSDLTKIKQQTVLLRNLSDDLFLDFFINVFTVSSSTDLSARRMYLEYFLLSEKKELLPLSNDFVKICENFESVELPFDCCWIPDISLSNNFSNSLYLLLHFYMLSYCLSLRPKLTKNISLFEFLKGVDENKVEGKIDDVLEKQFCKVLQMFDNFFLETIKKREMDNRCAITIVSLLQWRFLLTRFATVSVQNMNLEEYKNLIDELYVHYRWFIKHSVKQFCEQLRINLPEDLFKIIDKIYSRNTRDFSVIQKISNKFQKSITKSPPFQNEKQLLMYDNYKIIADDFDLNAQNDYLKLLSFLQKHKDVRTCLIKARIQLSDSSSDGQNTFTQLKYLHDEYTNAVEDCNDQTNLEMLPILDYFGCLAINNLKCNCHVVINKDVLEKVITVPSNIISVLECSLESNNYSKHELNSTLYWYLLNAACFSWFKCKHESENVICLSQFSPVLSILITDVSITKEDLRSTTFGNYRKITTQFESLGRLIWRNLLQISSSNYDYTKCEIKNINKSYKEFLLQLSNVFNVTGSSTTTERLNACIKKMKELFRTRELRDKDDILNLIIRLLKRCDEELVKLNGITNDDTYVNLMAVSNSLFLLNYLKSVLTSKLPFVDPILKTKLKRDYCEIEIQNFLRIVRSFELQNEIYSGTRETIHRYVPLIEEKLRHLHNLKRKLSERVAVRPSEINYSTIYKELCHYLEVVLSPRLVEEIYENLNDIGRKLEIATVATVDKSVIINTDEFEKVLQEAEQQKHNFISLIKILHKYRYNYSDIIGPLLSSITEFSYALALKINLNRALLMKYKIGKVEIDLDIDLINIAQFPVLNQNQKDYTVSVALYNHPRIQNFINTHLDDGKVENFRLLKCGMQELYNVVAHNVRYYKTVDRKIFIAFNYLLKIFVTSWKEQEEEQERKQKAQESVYRFTVKTEEEEITEDFNKRFPNFFDKDFSDLQLKLLDDDPCIRTKLVDYAGVISLDDVKFVSEVHLEFLRLHTETEWIFAKNVNGNVNFISPLLSKLKLYQRLSKKFGFCLNYHIDAHILGSLNILVNAVENFGDISNLDDHILTKTIYDFYKDSNVKEIKGSYQILEKLRLRTKELLMEWPDHPSLKLINTVIDRVYAFEMTSPLSRFLTGFEILLAKCHEWEENAHTGVSLQEHIQSIVQQIIAWRKIEMNVWKDSLHVAYERTNEGVAKWWFYIYDIILQFTAEDKNVAAESLVQTLQKFMEQSNVGEFLSRLQLLLTFHYHVVQLDRTKNTDTLAAILWNLYKYYKQYEANVVAKTNELRSPIEKKLKDYIKIVKWRDISYWSIKQTMERTHKTLHKYIREFEKVLQQPVALYLSLKESEGKQVGVSDKIDQNNTYVEDITSFIDNNIINWQFDATDKTTIVFEQFEKYFNKSRRFYKFILSKEKYSQFIEDLNGFVSNVIDSSIRLETLEINTSLTKDKQKSQAKGILQQKRKALSDLFKALGEMGLSYRTGLVQLRTSQEWSRCLIKPIELNASFDHLNKKKSVENDNRLLYAWKDCELYYYKAQIKLDILKLSLRSPAKDLGVQNLERCKGFSENLMQHIYKHKILLINTSRTFYYLRIYSEAFSSFDENVTFKRVSTEIYQKLITLLQNASITMKQYKIIFNTAPNDDNTDNDLPVLNSDVGEFIRCKNDSKWQYCVDKINNVLGIIQKRLSSLANGINSIPSVEFKFAKFVYMNISVQDVIDDLNLIVENLECLIEPFCQIPLTNSAQWLIDEMIQLKEILLNCVEISSDELNVQNFKYSAEKLLEHILIVVQNSYKKCKTNVSENHELLTTSILNNLLSDASILDMTGTLKHCHKSIKRAYMLNAEEISNCRKIISLIRSNLNRLILFYEYFLTQQVWTYRTICKMSCVLSNIFNELATKGFCVPPEFSEELQSKSGNREGDGMGLGDGEGENDVSDKIESEDQLEDTETTEQEKKEQNDENCKEEDKGIEMSEDFEAKMQDIEKSDEDDENQTADNDELNEQMGETNNDAAQLDQQIWGTDDEEYDSDDDKEQKETKGDGGEKQGEDELGAKDDENSNESDDRSGKNSENAKNEINEMKEPQYDDDQIDPYHGNPPQYPEPEAMDLPEDIEVDDDVQDVNENPNEENPFDIDTMKEQQSPVEHEREEEAKKNENEEDRNQNSENMSDDEMDNIEKREDLINNDESINKEDANVPDQESKECKDEKISQDSILDDTQTQQRAEAMDIDNIETGDNVEVNKSENQKTTSSNEETCQEDKPDKEGVGRSRMEESATGHAEQIATREDISSNRADEDDSETSRKPGETDSKRSLGNVKESVKKKLKTIEAQQKENVDEEQESNEEQNANVYQHIQDAKITKNQVLDAATTEQANEQKELPEIRKGENDDDESVQVREDQEENFNPEEDDLKQRKKESVDFERKRLNKNHVSEAQPFENLNSVDVEGEIVDTMTVRRDDSTTYHTRHDVSKDTELFHLSISQMNQIRAEVEHQLSHWSEHPTNAEAEQAWRKISSLTSALAQALAEQLRLVLEPTQTTRLKGDYRTGRRINMRKVIPYIASQFRKDKIWLRRTKPSKRNYQIALAIDDSSSMSDNHSKEIAFESVALISRALSLLESGQLTVLSFGETTEILHKLTDPFTERSGCNLLQKFQFAQKKTCIARLVDFTTEMMNSVQINCTALVAKLLIIVSDGRGIFSEGEHYVQQAVRRAKLANIFMVFVIIDNPESKDSILDIRMPIFKDGKLLGINPYMDSFPFPFYIILKNINSLPNVLSDALRQWFEIISNVDKH